MRLEIVRKASMVLVLMLAVGLCVYVIWYVIFFFGGVLTISDWIQLVSSGILMVSILVTASLSYKAIKEMRDQVRTTVYLECTRRYYDIVTQLPDEASDSQRSALRSSSANQDEIMGLMRAYYDLCSEQYYLHGTGKISHETWNHWREGLTFTIKLPTFREAWDEIREEGYKKSFVDFIEESRSS